MRTREEQIADLENQFGEEGTFTFVDDRDAATKHILEAEQRGYERARAECAADTRRIDTIEKLIAETVSVEFVGHFNKPETSLSTLSGVRIDGETGIFPNIRAAIDAAMEGEK